MNFLGVDSNNKQIYRQDTAYNHYTEEFVSTAGGFLIALGKPLHFVIIDWFRLQLTKNARAGLAGTYFYSFLNGGALFLSTATYLNAVAHATPEIVADRDVFINFKGGLYNTSFMNIGQALNFNSPILLTAGAAIIQCGYHYELPR